MSIGTDRVFIKRVAKVCEELLKNARHSVFDIGNLNETMMELERRAKELGLTRKDLYPDLYPDEK